MQNQKALFYEILPLIALFFAGKVLANTTNSQNTALIPNETVNADVGLFDADNSDTGVKNTKPFSVSVNQDSLLGLVVDTNTLLKWDTNNAAAVELAGGPRVFRANSTYGRALSDKSRIKITGEYLTEDLDFNFYSGDTRQWVNQGAVGAAYQYWLGGKTFKSLQVGSYYSHAPSKQLSTQTIALDNGTTLLDQRRIAGGNDLNGTAETGMSLWRHSLLTVGLDYDQVTYDTQYNAQDNNNAQGLGGHVQLQQLLSPSTQLDLQSNVSSIFSSYGAGLNWIWTSHKKTAWAAGLSSSYTNDFTTNRHFWVNGINLNVVWDKPHDNAQNAHYSDPDVAAQDLETWTHTPAVRMPDVLTVSDEKITDVNGNVNDSIDPDSFARISASCPAADELTYNSSAGTYSAGSWVESYPNSPITSNVEPIFESANIMSANAGLVECEYKVGLNKTILLTNSAYTHVEPTGSDWQSGTDPYWPSGVGAPAKTCGFGQSNTACVFETVDPNPSAHAPSSANKSTVENNTVSQRAPSRRASSFPGQKDNPKIFYREI